MPDFLKVCCCGHVRDEHERGVECTIDDCPCVQFEEDDEGDYPRFFGVDEDEDR